ncbi:hypothetical protein NDU88_003163 [Pleurodeles waltl]|uniref:Uncharacterized protein n=1 Tax=Pleurodeles waltl TaxID=8319 RepID=A0AAV7UXP3_PLEWA|nr:hypothetical protein NDU88_003163 [Pleurodeles waltl]
MGRLYQSGVDRLLGKLPGILKMGRNMNAVTDPGGRWDGRKPGPITAESCYRFQLHQQDLRALAENREQEYALATQYQLYVVGEKASKAAGIVRELG